MVYMYVGLPGKGGTKDYTYNCGPQTEAQGQNNYYIDKKDNSTSKLINKNKSSPSKPMI